MALSLGALATTVACRETPAHGPRLFVSNEADGTISVIDIGSHEVVETLPIGKRPRALHLSRDRRYLYVALSGSPRGGPGVDESTLPPPDRRADGIGVLDTSTGRVARIIPSGPDPESFDLVGDRTLVVSNEDAAAVSIVDIPTGTIRARVPVGTEPEGVTTAPDGKLVYVTSEGEGAVYVVDPVAAAVVAKIPTGARPRSVVFTADGARAFVADETDATVTVIDAKARTAGARIALPPHPGAKSPPRPMGTARSPDGKAIYVSTGRSGGIAVIDAASGAVVRTLDDIGARPWGIAAREGELYTANGSSNDVSFVDPETGGVLRVNVGHSPWGVEVE